MQFNPSDNTDPRWDEATRKAIEAKVDAAMALPPRLELNRIDGPLSSDDRRHVLVASFREIAKGASVDHLLTAPPALLEQFSVIALSRNHNIKGELVQLFRVFMMAYSEPATHQYACAALADLEEKVRAHIAQSGPPSWGPFAPMPGSPTRPPGSPTH